MKLKVMLLKILSFSFWVASIVCIFLMFTGGFSISILGGIIAICISGLGTKEVAKNQVRKTISAETKTQVFGRHAIAFVMCYAVSGYGLLYFVHMGIGRIEHETAELVAKRHGSNPRRPCGYEIKLRIEEGKTLTYCTSKELYAKYQQEKPDAPYTHQVKTTAILKRSILGESLVALRFL